jgi:hypothetical protein
MRPAEIAESRRALKGILGLPGYQSVNPACTVEALLQLDETLKAAERETARLRDEREQVDKALVAAEDIEAETSQALHGVLRIAKAQVFALYGPDSRAIEAIGWKRASDRKRPTRKKAS